MLKFNKVGWYNMRGASLMEVLVTTFILTVILCGATYIFAIGMRGTRNNQVRLQARNYAKSLMEEILSKRWEESSGQPLGSDSGESRSGTTASTAFDDVDDYNLFSEFPPTFIDGTQICGAGYYPDCHYYQRRVTVEYLNPSTLASSGTATDYKGVTVTVNYSASGNFATPESAYTLKQIVTNHT